MSDFLGISKVEVNERFLDQVAAGQRESNAARLSSDPAEGRAASVEGSAAARAQARNFVEVYFSSSEEK